MNLAFAVNVNVIGIGPTSLEAATTTCLDGTALPHAQLRTPVFAQVARVQLSKPEADRQAYYMTAPDDLWPTQPVQVSAVPSLPMTEPDEPPGEPAPVLPDDASESYAAALELLQMYSARLDESWTTARQLELLRAYLGSWMTSEATALLQANPELDSETTEAAVTRIEAIEARRLQIAEEQAEVQRLAEQAEAQRLADEATQ